MMPHNDKSGLSREAVSPPMVLLSILGMVRFAKAMYAAVRLGIPDRLKDGPQSASKLAQDTRMYEDALYRLLRALASIGIFEETQRFIFANTDLSTYLCTDHPGSMHDLVLWLLSDWDWASWGEIEYSIRTGRSAFEHVHGVDIWTFLDAHPEAHSTFSGAMTAISQAIDLPITQVYDFSSLHTLADIGGGHGGFLCSILKANPSLHGILFDSEPVILEAREQIAREQLNERCTLLSGSFFDEIPPSADAYLFKYVFHDWDDQASMKILAKCRTAMKPGNKLLIIEQVLPLLRAPSMATSTDLTMLLDTGGRERTEEEFRVLLEASGFSVTRIIPVRFLHSVIEGVAVS
jgi:hypothetical protein